MFPYSELSQRYDILAYSFGGNLLGNTTNTTRRITNATQRRFSGSIDINKDKEEDKASNYKRKASIDIGNTISVKEYAAASF